MDSKDRHHKDVVQVTKEVVLKFIETQRISPANFPEIFPAVYKVVQRTLGEQTEQADTKATTN